jgi:hypothetical protein
LVRIFYEALPGLMPRVPRGEELISEMREANRVRQWVDQRAAVSKTLAERNRRDLLPVACELLRCKVLDVSRPSLREIAGFAGEAPGSVDRLIKAVVGIFPDLR